MKGYIKIETTVHEGKEGLSVETELEDISFADRLQALHSFCHAMHLGASELKLMAGLLSSGVFDDVATIVDLSEDSTAESQPERSCKEPNVHVVGGSPDVIHALLKALLD